MITITEKQHEILKVIPTDVGIKYGEMLKRSGLQHNYLSGSLQELVRKGALIREGKRNHFTFRAAEGPFIVVEGRLPPVPKEAIPDPNLEKAAAIELTDEQLLYLKNHRDEKRSVLARKLGISRLELNFAIEKLGRAVKK